RHRRVRISDREWCPLVGLYSLPRRRGRPRRAVGTQFCCVEPCCSRGWRRLTFDRRESRIDASPGRRFRDPDRGVRFGDLHRVEAAAAHEDQMRARLGFAEQLRSAGRAETPTHGVAAVADAAIVDELAFDAYGVGGKAGVDGTTPRAEILANPAPAD